MDGSNGKVLKDDSRLGVIRNQLVHVGLRLFAVRALEVGKLDQLQILGRGAAVGAVGVLLQLLASVSKGIVSESDDVVTADDVLAIGKIIERENLRLLFAGLVSNQNDDLAYAVSGRLENGLNLPHAVGVVAPIVLKKCVDHFLCRNGSGEIGRIGLGKHR